MPALKRPGRHLMATLIPAARASFNHLSPLPFDQPPSEADPDANRRPHITNPSLHLPPPPQPTPT
jgi:hypothetical protein